ncbi:ribonuclease HI [Corynebacterium amycolatum]|uniref:RNase H family protein n=1 Tax=Corynebacterium TaxID=1716 RepID=UPI0008A50715|nr:MULTISPECIES: RNase H family protein [Corynebacterium]ASE56078.1 ribonuclease HI [Corynebacterium jeikeium]KAA9244343.1 ribonuclease HI [Corynebacterium amycolatum]MBC6768979.1 ribonuclease HI [Corynebacterium sp. LK15]MDK6475887.1 ribonuclease HI [Corynebacterium amycolatum]OFR60745.1 ribonuclease H [Corynebacterium sp. HMSC065H09]
MTITAAVDGSALHNPGPAGWCWYIDDSCWAAGGWKEGTNNRGELTALAELLRATAHIPDEPLFVLCDSQYVINSVTKWMPGWKRKGWKKRDGKPVLNVDILQDIDQLLVGRNIHLEWVKGHSGHDMNEAADQRARAAATAYQKGTAVPEGPGFAGAGSRAQTNAAPTKTAPAAPSSEPKTPKAATFEQEGLFDLAVDTTVTPEDAAKEALTIFRRAAHRAEQGNARALKALLNDALGANLAVPDGLSDAEHELRIEGTTATAQFTTDDWVGLAVWDLSQAVGKATGSARLLGWNVGRS